MQATFHIKREQNRQFHIEHYNKMGGALHFHSHIEILLVRRGAAEVCIGGEREVLRANEVAVVMSYEPHRFCSMGEDAAYTDMFIPTHLCPEFLEAVQNKRVHHPFLRDAETAARVFAAADELARQDLNHIERQGYIHIVLGTILKQLTFEPVRTPQDTDLPARMLFYINEHYKEEISPAVLAKALGYSADHLAKCFRACFHLGLGRYVNTVRLKNAVTLMREGKLSMTACALESGFPSLRTFYRVFSEEFGCAPREYLKQE